MNIEWKYFKDELPEIEKDIFVTNFISLEIYSKYERYKTDFCNPPDKMFDAWAYVPMPEVPKKELIENKKVCPYCIKNLTKGAGKTYEICDFHWKTDCFSNSDSTYKSNEIDLSKLVKEEIQRQLHNLNPKNDPDVIKRMCVYDREPKVGDIVLYYMEARIDLYPVPAIIHEVYEYKANLLVMMPSKINYQTVISYSKEPKPGHWSFRDGK